MTEQIKGMLFDKDGTLFDFQTTWGAWAKRFFLDIAFGDRLLAANISRQLGYDYETEKFSKDSVIIAGTPDEVTAALIEVTPGWEADKLVAHVNKVTMEVPQSEPVPLIPLLEGFRAQGLKLGVATNDAEAPARAHLNGAGITYLFDFIAGFDSGFGAKPATGMQIGFCEAVNLEPSQVMMIGDSTHDLISGRDAGMMTVAVLTGMAEAHELAPFADVVLQHIGEIPALMAR
ncbi:MAG: HAD family hydrolase [Alphaproteobacteria bacterium]|nr:HAD family hydrolase [Alphaproteobacteria bacterium]